MLKQRARALSTGLRALDVGLLGVAFIVAYWLRDTVVNVALTGDGLYPIERYLGVLALAVPYWLISAWVNAVYAGARRDPPLLEVWRVGRAIAMVTLAVAATLFLLKQEQISRAFVGLYGGVSFVLVAGNRLLVRLSLRAARRRGKNTRAFAIVGSGELAEEVAESIVGHREWGFTFAGFILEAEGAPVKPRYRVLGTARGIDAILEREVIDEVIFAVPRQRLDDLEDAFLACEERGINAKLCLNFFPHKIAKVTFEDLDGIPLLGFSTIPSEVGPLVVKRVFDLVLAGLGLLVLSPLLAVVSILVRLESRGPILFRQVRVGLNGRPFTLYKFRSMVADAESRRDELEHLNEMDGPVFKVSNDPRVTRVGRFIRKTSIDELPQLFNVLRGEMSVVGPRPPLPAEVSKYQRWQRRRLSVKPGITCLWQVNGRNHIDFEQWIALDLDYIDNWSLWGDLKIVLKTIPVVLLGRGAR